MMCRLFQIIRIFIKNLWLISWSASVNLCFLLPHFVNVVQNIIWIIKPISSRKIDSYINDSAVYPICKLNYNTQQLDGNRIW